MEFVLKLASKPGVPNKNGIVYSEETFRKMIRSEFTEESIKNGCLYVTLGTDICTQDHFTDFTVKLEDCIGKVSEWEGTDVNVDITSSRFVDIVKELYKQDRIELGMNYYCRLEKRKDGLIEAKGMKIHSLSLVDKLTGLYFKGGDI